MLQEVTFMAAIVLEAEVTDGWKLAMNFQSELAIALRENRLTMWRKNKIYVPVLVSKILMEN